MVARTALIAFSLALVACSKPAPDEGASQKNAATANKDPHSAFANLSVDEVSNLVADKKCVPVDANSTETRSKFGVVPGAVLLSDYTNFKTSELPADKSTKLVFYCGSEACTAAPKAAQLAAKQGYGEIRVMRAGIKGWVAAGKSVTKPAT